MEMVSIVIAATIAIAIILDRKDKRKDNVVRIAAGIVDEAICYSEQRHFQAKREAVFSAAQIWRKNAPEVLKDEVKGNQFMMTAMEPIRNMCHQDAISYMRDAIAAMSDKDMAQSVTAIIMPRVDLCIRTRITSSKLGTQDTLHMFLYRYI